MEARIARLESDVSHLRSDVGEIKLDLRSLRDRVDGGITQMHQRADKQDTKIDALRDDLASTKIWALMLYFGLAGIMLATMARGFGWI